MEVNELSPQDLSPKVLSPKAARTRGSLLDAADRLLWSGQSVTSSSAAAEAGVATGTFYRYFADKDEALAAVFARHLDALIDAVEAALEPGRVMDHGIAPVLDGAVEDVAAGYAQRGPAIAAALARMRSSAAVRAVYRSRHARATEVFATFLRRVDRSGMATVGDVAATSVAAVVLVEGLNHPALRNDPDGTVRRRIAHALHALVTTPPDHAQ